MSAKNQVFEHKCSVTNNERPNYDASILSYAATRDSEWRGTKAKSSW